MWKEKILNGFKLLFFLAIPLFSRNNLEGESILKTFYGTPQYMVLKEGCGDIVDITNTPLLKISGYNGSTPFEKKFVAHPSELGTLDNIIIGMREGEKRKVFIDDTILEIEVLAADTMSIAQIKRDIRILR